MLTSRCQLGCALLVLAISLLGSPAAAQVSLHEMPNGTVVEGSFKLAGRVFPLPEGKFKFVFSDIHIASPIQTGNSPMTLAPGKLVYVALLQIEEGMGRIFVLAGANLGNQNVRWNAEPCKRTDTLLRVDRLNTFDYRADCLLINHQVGFLRNPTGIWVGIRDQIFKEKISFPIPVMLDATFTRIEHNQYMSISYWVNPLAFGYSDVGSNSWSGSTWHKVRVGQDDEKAAFVSALTTWAKRLMSAIDEGFHGKELVGDLRTLPLLELPRKKK